MYLPFESMPGWSRVWVYQASRPFTKAEKQTVENGLRELCDGWVAHGTPLHTSYSIRHDQFVILAVDETQAGASGCSIDGSVRYLKTLQPLGLDFFDRTLIAFLQKNMGNQVALYPASQIRTLLDQKILTTETTTFNNLVATKDELEKNWKIPVRESWLASQLPKSSVAG